MASKVANSEYACIYIYIYIYIYTCAYMSVHVHTHACTNTHAHTCTSYLEGKKTAVTSYVHAMLTMGTRQYKYVCIYIHTYGQQCAYLTTYNIHKTMHTYHYIRTHIQCTYLTASTHTYIQCTNFTASTQTDNIHISQHTYIHTDRQCTYLTP
jgi:hypothetical protein